MTICIMSFGKLFLGLVTDRSIASISKDKISDLSKLKSSCRQLFNPLPDDKILEWSKLKQLAADILKCI